MPAEPVSLEILPQEVNRRLAAGEPLQLIDVREPGEYQIAHLADAQLIPMRSIPAHLPAIEEAAEQAPLIVYCHHGVRSLQVVAWLREQGVEACQSMTGGIDRWSLEIDPAVPRY